MNYRQAELLATEAITTAAVKPIDINVSDVISRLTVILELVNNGTDPTNHPLAAIKTIEVVDGSDVIASMTGYGAQAVCYYDSGKMPHNELNYEDNAYARCFVPINFGRYLYDPELALDPKKYKNLQLRIDHNYALGGSSPDGAYLRVLADMFDEKVVSPSGYLQNKEIFSFTPAAGAAAYVTLPLDNAIRKIVVMNVNDNEEPDIQFETVKIDEDDGKRVLVDCLTMDLIRNASTMFGRFSEYFSGHLAATTDNEFWLSASKDIMIAGFTDTASVVLKYTWSGGRARVIQASAAAIFNCNVSGRCPHGAVPIFFGNQQNMGDWWDMSRVGKARLILTPRATAGGGCDTEKTTDVIVQSYQRY